MKFKVILILLILLFNNYVIAQPDLIFKTGFEFIQELNDTGITWGGDYPSGNNMDCTSNITSPQDCNTGRDANPLTNSDTDGHAGFSFIKLDGLGDPLTDQSVDYATTPWACVKDNVTGLVWEVKTPSTDIGGIHNKDNAYKWGGITAIGLGHQDAEGIYYNDWDTLVNESNMDNFCGFNNWRVPTSSELSGMAHQGTFNPAIDTNYFPNTVSWFFWSASPIASNDLYAWIVYSGFGSTYGNDRDSSYHVRLVRSP